MDEWQFEMAARAEEAQRAAAQQRAQDAQRVETHPGFDGEHCVECEEAIPAQRLRMGKVRCVECQTILERGRRG